MFSARSLFMKAAAQCLPVDESLRHPAIYSNTFNFQIFSPVFRDFIAINFSRFIGHNEVRAASFAISTSYSEDYSCRSDDSYTCKIVSFIALYIDIIST